MKNTEKTLQKISDYLTPHHKSFTRSKEIILKALGSSIQLRSNAFFSFQKHFPDFL